MAYSRSADNMAARRHNQIHRIDRTSQYVCCRVPVRGLIIPPEAIRTFSASEDRHPYDTEYISISSSVADAVLA
jgi:hypothetical protein